MSEQDGQDNQKQGNQMPGNGAKPKTKRKQYSEDSMEAAIKAVEEGTGLLFFLKM